MKQIFLATSNEGKIKEFRNLVEGLNVEVKSVLDNIEIPEVDETEETFEGNSQKKALEISQFLNMIVISDDSGLCVDALNGRPGVYSARYSGEDGNSERNIDKVPKPFNTLPNPLNREDGNSERNIDKVLGELADIHEDDKRSAKFVSVVSIAYPNGKIKSYRGEVEGRILNERDGKNGFGYDSIFYSTDLKKSFGQATPDEKKQVSHRARAFAQLRKEELEK